MRELTMLLSSSSPSVSDSSATTIRKPAAAFATVMPWSRTSCGRRGSARLMRFCTSTAAMSMLVPFSKERLMLTEPVELLVELKNSRPFRPVSCCSITVVTELSMTSALAPG